jgi:uncharacterized lipoprotein NlpE involved in copper resistance
VRALLALVAVTALAGCTSRAEKQLEAVKSVRSILAEWALVEAQASKGRSPQTYADEMRQDSKDELEKAAKDLAGQPGAAQLVAKLRAGSPDSAALKQAADRLEPLEKSLEAA